MKQKVIHVIEKINIILVVFFLILNPIFLGLYRNAFITLNLILLTILTLLYLILLILNHHKIQKRFLLYLLFVLSFLIPILFGIGQYKIEGLQNFALMILSFFFVMDVIYIWKDNQDTLFKVLILSTVITSIISMIGTFQNELFDKLHIAYGYSDFNSTSVNRLYGTLRYPNTLAVFNMIGIILSFRYLDKKRYNIALYINLLVLSLTMSKSIILFLVFALLLLIIFHKKSYYHLLALLLPLMYNITSYRNCYINNDLIGFLIITIILILFYFIIYRLLNRHFKFTIILISSILLMGILFPYNSLTIKKSSNPIIITDFMNLPKNSIYKLSFDIEEEDLKGQVLIKKKVLEDNVRRTYIVGIADLSKTKEVYFKTVENSEYYVVELFNSGSTFVIDKFILQDAENSQNIYVNYSLYPYNYIKMFEHTKKDSASLGGRQEIYQDCVQIIKNSPFLGHGFQYFKYYTTNNMPSHSAIEEHSYILRLGVENGLISVAIWLFIMVSIAIQMIRNLNKEYVSIILVIGLLLFSSLYDFIFSYQYFFILLFLFDMLLDYKKANS